MIKSWKIFNESKISYWQSSDQGLAKFNLSKEDVENIFQDLMDDYPKFSISIEPGRFSKNSFLVELHQRGYAIGSKLYEEIEEMKDHLEQINGRLGDYGLTIKDDKGSLAFPYKGELFIIIEEIKNINENMSKKLEWEFSVEEVTHILQDIIDDGIRIDISELQWNRGPNPIVIRVFSNVQGFLSVNQKDVLLGNFKLTINRLIEFGFSDFWIDSYNELFNGRFPYMEVILNDGVRSNNFVGGKKCNIKKSWLKK